ncbi:MAG: hypothetical protein ACXWMN_00720 [Candidatus Limnocylindria bacterium]
MYISPSWAIALAVAGAMAVVIALAVAAHRGGLSISWAFGHVDGNKLMVGFVGDRCGTDYTAEAVESTSAVVVIIVEHSNPTTGGCRGVGTDRTATAQLAAPLSDRSVLEVRQGLPAPVTLVP